MLRGHTAGAARNPEVTWTNRSRRRNAVTAVATGSHPDRKAPFATIARRNGAYRDAGVPVLSTDTKAQDGRGPFHRGGAIETPEPGATNAPDFGSHGLGTLLPPGLDEGGRAEGFVYRNASRDTGASACDGRATGRERRGRTRDPGAQAVLLRCAGGGCHRATPYPFEDDVPTRATRRGLALRVARDPPACATYNPRAQRPFAPVRRACRGVIFHTVGTARHDIGETELTTGSKGIVGLPSAVYETGRKYTDDVQRTMKIVFDPVLPTWNYTAIPEPV